MLFRVAMIAVVFGALSMPADAKGRGGGRGGGGGGGGGTCNVCGCKGGPGYRAPNGRCVGHRNIRKVCGVPPSTRCKKESALTGPQVPPVKGPASVVPNPFS